MIEFDDDAFELVDGDRRIAVPYPSGGYGGHELVVSARGRFAAVFLYTGQSEEGYELFALSPKLRHLGGLPQMGGEGHAPVFSDDENWIAIGIAIDPMLAGEPDDGLVDWALICVQDLRSLDIARCRVRVRANVEREEENSYVEGLRFTDEGLSFVATWGTRVTLAVPPPTEVDVDS